MKKMTHGGGAPVVLSIIALVLGLVASFQEYIFRFIYNTAFDADSEKVFVNSVIGYFEMNRNDVRVISMFAEKAFIVTIIALIAVVIFASSGKKKTVVSGQAIMLMGVSAACLIEPAVYLINFFSSDMKDGLSSDNDGIVFRTIYSLAMYALPVLVVLLLVIAGLIILCRIAAEQNKVEVASKPAKTKNVTLDASNPIMPGIAGVAVGGSFVSDAVNEAPQMQDVVATPEYQQAAEPVQPVVEENASVFGELEAVEESVEETVSVFEQQAPVVEEVQEAVVEPVIEEAVPQTVFCANCGQQLAGNAKFCNNCGARR